MKKNEVEAIFRMSYADLMQLGDKAVALITRDSAELAPYGVDPVLQALIAGKTHDLKEFPTDEELQSQVSDLTETKNTSADAIKVDVRSIMVRAKSGFGEHTAKYRRFGTKHMDKLTDNNLVKCGKRVVRVATLYLPVLAAKGLTQAIIDALGTKNQTFDVDIDLQDDAVRQRDTATEDRLELGNELYKKITEVFDFGKDYWVTRDEAKYNDYVIYDTPSSSGNVVLTGSINMGQIANILGIANTAWQVGATLKIKNTSVNPAVLIFYVADNPIDSYSGMGGQTLAQGQEVTHTVTAPNFKPYVNVQNQSASNGSYEITIM